MSPTQRTLAHMRNQGYMIEVVEKFNRFGNNKFGFRKDLFNIIDCIACKEGEGIIGVQCGTGSGHQAHKRKIVEENKENTERWLMAGGRIMIYSWRKLKVKRGSKGFRYEPIIEEIKL